MVLEQIVEALAAPMRKVGRVGQYAVLGLALAFGACGEDGNVPPEGDDTETCEVRETERCEDFTGLYKITNYEEFLECNTLPPGYNGHHDSQTWVEGDYISFVRFGNVDCGDPCRLAVYNHTETHHFQDGEIQTMVGCGSLRASGNRAVYSDGSIDETTAEAVRCDINKINLKYQFGAPFESCQASLSKISEPSPFSDKCSPPEVIPAGCR